MTHESLHGQKDSLKITVDSSNINFEFLIAKAEEKVQLLHSCDNDSLIHRIYYNTSREACGRDRFRLCDSITQYYLDIVEKKGDTLHYLKIMHFQGVSYNRTGDYHRQIGILFKGYRMCKAFNDSRLLATYINRIAWFNFYIGANSKALSWASQLLPLLESGHYPRSYYHNLMASIYQQSNQLNKALVNFNLAIDAAKNESRSLSKEALYRSNRSGTYRQLDSMGKAMEDIKFSVKVNYEKKEWHQYAGNIGIYAKLLFLNGEFEKALKKAKRSLSFGKRFDSYRSKASAYHLLYLMHKDRGNYELAMKYLDTVSNQYVDPRQYEIFGKMMTQLYDTEVQLNNRELAISEKEKELSLFRLEKAERNWWIMLFGAIAVLLFISLIYDRRNRMQYLKSENEKKRLENEILETEMKALRSQMNPHFLFNSLNSIKSFIIKKDPRTATDYLNKFSRLMRLILNHSKEKMIDLGEELEASKLYMELEKARFSDKFDFQLIVDEGVNQSYKIPPLILQPFLENAVWHAFGDLERRGNLLLHVRDKEQYLEIVIDDDGVGRAHTQSESMKVKTHKGVGVAITRSRVTVLENNGVKGRIDILDKKNGYKPGGTRVVLTIPKITDLVKTVQ